MRWPYPLPLPLQSLCWTLSHKSSMGQDDARLHADNNHGDHMLLLRDEIYGFSSSSTSTSSYFSLQLDSPESGETAENFSFVPVTPRIFISLLRFPPFSLPRLHPSTINTPRSEQPRGKLKYFSILSFSLDFLSFFSVPFFEKNGKVCFMNYCIHLDLIFRHKRKIN